ncbi:MAG TPA: hypothetical protein VFM07_03690 [Intrasporangium sp.]|nr:hypothetical protein [Intrasporangium sp.]
MSWDDLIEIFNPGHRHLAEERDRKRLEAQIPESEGDPLRDFEQGIIRITLKEPPSEPLHRPEPAPDDQTEEGPARSGPHAVGDEADGPS